MRNDNIELLNETLAVLQRGAYERRYVHIRALRAHACFDRRVCAGSIFAHFNYLPFIMRISQTAFTRKKAQQAQACG